MLTDKRLRTILIIAILQGLLLLAGVLLLVHPAVLKTVSDHAQDESVRVASHLIEMLRPQEQLIQHHAPSPDFIANCHQVRQDFNLVKIKFFDTTGLTIFSTDPADIGARNTHPFFRDQVMAGEIVAKTVHHDKPSLEQEKFHEYLVETYVPLMEQGRFLGAFEIYYDISDRLNHLERILNLSLMALILTIMIFWGGLILALRQAGKNLIMLEESKNRQERNNRLLAAIKDVQCGFIARAGGEETCPALLELLVSLSGSRLGFVGEVQRDQQSDQPLLVWHALTPNAWEETSPELATKFKREGMVIRNLKNLIGQAVLTGQVVLSNDPAADPRRGGLPAGHPPLTSFMGLPLKNGAEVIGMAGLANRPGGYSQNDVEYLAPLIQVVANLLNARRNTSRQQHLLKEMRQDESLKSLGTLAGGIAHDFNNLLTGILGNISLAKRLVENKNEQDELIPVLNNAATASRHAADLVAQLLLFARGERRRQNAIQIQLAPLIRETVGVALADCPQIKPVFFFSLDLLPITGDPGQLRQLVSNLIRNACEAMPEGGSVTIRAENLPAPEAGGEGQPAAGVRITVEDEGPRIPEEAQARVFEPYFSGKPLDSQKGRGLGLAICQAVVKAHRGSLKMASAPGRGTIFTIDLPAASPTL